MEGRSFPTVHITLECRIILFAFFLTVKSKCKMSKIRMLCLNISVKRDAVIRHCKSFSGEMWNPVSYQCTFLSTSCEIAAVKLWSRLCSRHAASLHLCSLAINTKSVESLNQTMKQRFYLVPSNTPADHEVHMMNGSRDMQRTGRQRSLL